MRSVVSTAKYIPPPITPTQHSRTRRTLTHSFSAGSLGGAETDGYSPTRHLAACLKTSPSKSSLSQTSSRASTPSRAKAGEKLTPLSSKPRLPLYFVDGGGAGVDQAEINPSIPFSGFPSLTYLRGV